MLKIKFLWIGLFLAFPPVAAWALRGSNPAPETPPPALEKPAEAASLKMPVEVVARGEKTEWVMIDVQNEAIPEPGTLTLLITLSCVLLLRRQREE